MSDTTVNEGLGKMDGGAKSSEETSQAKSFPKHLNFLASKAYRS
jgi:hypothetical protein